MSGNRWLAVGLLGLALIFGWRAPARAETTVFSGNIVLAQPLTLSPSPITPVFNTITTFTGYTGPFPFISQSFYVAASGNYSFNLLTPVIANGIYVLRGTFAPNQSANPSTPLANFIVFQQALTNSTVTATLQAGEQYSFLGVFGGGLASPYTVTVTGPGILCATICFDLNSLPRLAQATADLLALRTASLVGPLGYDCDVFDRNGFCIAVGGRVTSAGSSGDGAGTLVGAYRLGGGFRAGFLIEMRGRQDLPSSVRAHDDTPVLGAFVAYSARPDGTGLQARVSSAFEHGRVGLVRFDSVTGGVIAVGAANLDSLGLAAHVGWGFPLSGVAALNGWTITPHVGVRYTDVTRAAYSEPGATSVASYETAFERLFTATAGVRVAGQITDRIGASLGIGGEVDLDRWARGLLATIPGAVVGIGAGNTGNRVRANATAGLSFALTPTQRIAADVIVRQEAFGGDPSVTAVASWRVGF